MTERQITRRVLTTYNGSRSRRQPVETPAELKRRQQVRY